MKPLKLLAFIALLVIFATPVMAEDLADRDWSVSAKQSLVKFTPSNQDVARFVSKILNADWTTGICSFTFINPDKSENYYLVASTDASGRRMCNQLVVIGKNGKTFGIINEFKVWMLTNTNNALQDLDHDGTPELIFAEPWSTSEGMTRCRTLWGKVYQWRLGRFVDASDNYPNLYKMRLKELEASIPQQSDPSCQQMESDKIMRFLGISPHAGFERATEWMRSDDRLLRRKASAVFADIKDEPSIKNLFILIDDKDPLVAESAKLDLAAARQHKE